MSFTGTKITLPAWFREWVNGRFITPDIVSYRDMVRYCERYGESVPSFLDFCSYVRLVGQRFRCI